MHIHPPYRALAFCLFAFVLNAYTQSPGIVLADNGASAYQIVIADEPADEEYRAATELQFYLEKMSGVQLPIVQYSEKEEAPAIWVGDFGDGEGLKEHQVRIQEKDGNLMIRGGHPRSTLFAAYTFLEDILGRRFYSPDVEKVPRLSGIEIPKGLNYDYTPPITTRTVHSKLYYDNPFFADKRKVTHEAFPNYVPEARVHTFHHFVPESQYYSDHPEYYALREGRRIPTQLCLTNPEVLKLVKDSVAALLERYPEAQVISVSQDDNQQYCQCEACSAIDEREGAPSGSLIAFVNEVAAAFPDKTISTLAYQYTRKAPLHLKPAENVLITLCSIECDRSAPIAQNCQDFTRDLIAWGKKTDKIRIWDYTTQFTNFLAPFPNLRTLQPNIQLFAANNAEWIFEQHSNQPSELFELRSYLTAKLLWNPDVNVDTIMKDFLDGYYEEAGAYIGKYISTVHDALAADPGFFLFLYGDPSQAFDSFLKPELLQRYGRWMDEAEQAVAHKPAVLERVKIARLSIDYAILEASRQQLSDEFSLVEKAADGQLGTPAKLSQRLKNFQEVAGRAGITYMNEMGYSVEEYVQFYEFTLERAKQVNKARNHPVTLLEKPKKYANENPQALTDGALGGSSFYANWLGFEGNNLEAVIDLEEAMEFSEISSAFLQVVNHIVFFPEKVSYYYSVDGKDFVLLGHIPNARPLERNSKVNDIQNFSLSFDPVKGRYIKVKGENLGQAPIWHHGAGLPAWIFADEVMVR
ncbi:MAG: DUF4838 domain-containing protein [Lewinellaceae bacterium]|nr:DUF4838 domain-containing protein [Phaeodactylibacter sp.]MCB0612638.1 DUF4838 domain-containing protein [Phaeodactylibacter sp.]MCB9348606.1 DUF4838 domain-containing protein [Lewinellaceae bacterium]